MRSLLSQGNTATNRSAVRVRSVRREILLGLVVLTLGGCAISVITEPKAYANYHVEVCSDLVTGAPSYSSGWSASQSGAFTGASLCNGGGYMWAALFRENAHSYGEFGKLVFNAPANTSISSFELWRWDHASENQVDGSPQNEISYDGQIIDNCSQAYGCTNEGYTNNPAQSVVGAYNLNANQIEVLALCGGGPGGTCLSSPEASQIFILGGDINLNQPTSPVPGAASGSLIAAGTHSGTESASFSATDNGSGVYSAALEIDGVVVASQIPNSNGGRCQATRQNSDGSLVFNYVVPCPASASGTFTYDTGNLSDGNHEVQIVIADAAGNTATAFDGTITTENAPHVSSPPSVSGVAQVGSTLTGVPAVFEARSGLTPLGAVSNRWMRCSGSGTGCSAIAGASASTYTLTAADKGYTIEYGSSVEDAKKHKASSTSAPTIVVTEAPASGGCATEPGCVQGGNGGKGGNGGNGTDGGNGGTGAGGGTSTTNNSSTTTNSSSESLSNEALLVARGAANGSPASDQATIAVHWLASASASSVKVAYTRAARAEGRLIGSGGQPIAGAVVQVMGVPSSPGLAAYSEGSVTTAADGTFMFDTRGKRSSRTLEFEYKSHVNDLSLAAEASLNVNVPVPISLKVTPRSVGRGSRIRMTGTVPAPIPAGGKQIVLQALALGVRGAKWQTFNVVRTSQSGRFKASYRFRFAGPARYRIRAVSRYEQDYPYLANNSPTMLVRER